jgi:formylglycine-generating enzyme required for sulfatase activity
MRYSPVLFAMVLFAMACAQGAVSFESKIAPVLIEKCLPCHSSTKAAGSVRLTTGVSVSRVIVPGAPEKSPLYLTVESGSMPPGGPKLPQDQRNAIRDWIKEGAKWPVGISLEGTRVAADEKQLVARLHDRIVKSNAPAPSTMVKIPEGDYVMGSPKKDEAPAHKVHIDAFFMDKYEVTWDQYRLFMFAKDEGVDAVSRPTRPYVEMSFGMGIEGFPAISMTQHAANKYAEWLSQKTGQFYRLPTEAEWEYACRAGTTTAYSFGDDLKQLANYAYFAANSGGKYQKVGTKLPNPWGLYDMHGNVMEWTLDQYSTDFYAKSPAANPWNKATTPYPHAVRGGSWQDPAEQLTCSARVASDPSWKMQDPQLPKSIWYETDAQGLGFRLVRPLKIPTADEMYKYWNSGVEKDN